MRLHFLRCLPEKQVRADGGAEYPHHHRRGGGIRREARPDGASRHLAPGDVNDEQDRCVSEQREGQPFENVDIAVVGDVDLRRQRDDDEHRRHEMTVDMRHQFGDLSHRG
jgi:hypothetical protein